MGQLVVYTTQSLSLEPIIYTLNNGWDHDGTETYDFWGPAPAGTPSFVGAPVSSIIAHHRALPETAREDPFVVVDRIDWENEGVLGVNMNDNGYIDAARFPARNAGIDLVNVEIANVDWYELLEQNTLDTPSFVLYSATPTLDADEESKEALRRKLQGCPDNPSLKDGEKSMEALRWKLQAGLASRKQYNDQAVTLHLAPSSPEVIDEDVSAIAAGHERVAQGLGCDTQLFIVADEADWAEKGVLIGKIGKDEVKVDTCRRSVDVAAEILQWVRAGLFTWEEGKVWDEKRDWDEEEEGGEGGEIDDVGVEEMGGLQVQVEL